MCTHELDSMKLIVGPDYFWRDDIFRCSGREQPDGSIKWLDDTTKKRVEAPADRDDVMAALEQEHVEKCSYGPVRQEPAPPDPDCPHPSFILVLGHNRCTRCGELFPVSLGPGK